MSDVPSFGPLLGTNALMRDLFAVASRVVSHDTSVLVTGEPGTGKTLLAQTIHEQSSRSASPLIAVDCAQPPDTLARDLDPGPDGAWSKAAGGSLLLENVASTPLPLQIGLARLLQAPPGETERDPRRPRILATTTIPLRGQVDRGMLREDLFFCLNVVPLVVPPLRDRPEDIAVLAAQFLEQAQHAQSAAQRLTLGAAAVRALTAHDWPGNATELRAVVMRAVTAPDPTGSQAVGPSEVAVGSGFGSLLAPVQFDPEATYREVRAAFERDFEQRFVGWLLTRHNGNVSAAARAARMDRKHLYDLAKRHGLRSPSTRRSSSR